jgi:hypothetical protein
MQKTGFNDVKKLADITLTDDHTIPVYMNFSHGVQDTRLLFFVKIAEIEVTSHGCSDATDLVVCLGVCG